MKQTILFFALLFSSLVRATCTESCDVKAAYACLRSAPDVCNRAMGSLMEEVIKNQGEIMKNQEKMMQIIAEPKR